MELQLKPEASLKEDTVETPSLSLKFNQVNPATRLALHALVKGCEEEELVKKINDTQELIYFYYYLNLLKKHGLLLYKTPLIKLIPFDGKFSYETPSKETFQLSRFALCRSQDNELVIETPLSPTRTHIQTAEGLQFYYAFCKPRTLNETLKMFSHLPEDEVKETFSLLLSAKILVTGEESIASSQWDFHDLYFHARSRIGRQDAPLGGTFRFRGKTPSLPSVKTCHREVTIDLPKPEEALILPLEQVIYERKSIRKHGKKAITLQQLGEFLYRCAHVKQVFVHEDEEFTSRPYPGGGARYELEIYPVIYECEGLKQGVYHYHPLEHQFCKISNLDKQAEEFLRDAKRASGIGKYPQVLITVSARFQRVSWKYQSMAYALILKNLGVLLQTMYLVATAMKLAPCAIGAGNSDLFCEVMGTNYLEETSVGEFMLGSRF